MKNNPEHIFKILKKIHLNAEEKASMRFRIVKQIELATPYTQRPSITPSYKSPFFFPHLALGRRALAGFVAVLLVGSTGVSFAAENTLPGDILYPVKIHVTEEVRSALTVGSTAKVKWEKDRVVKRVVETEKLIKNKALTPERKKEAEAAIKQQIQNFSDVANSEKLNPVAVIDATSDLEPTLKAHQEVLLALSSDTQEEETSTQDIINTVEEGIKVSSVQESAALDSVNTISTDDLSSAVDTKISDTEKEITTLTETADTEATASDTTTPTTADTASKDDKKSDTVAGVKDDIKKEVAPLSLETTSTPQTKEVTPIAPDTKSDTTLKTIEPLKIDTEPVSSLSTNTTVVQDIKTKKADIKDDIKISATDTKIQRRKDVLEAAKVTLELAHQKREKGELSEALRLAQQAYKSVLELNVGTQLSKQAEEKTTKTDSPTTPNETSKKEETPTKPVSSATDPKQETTKTTESNTTVEIKPENLKAQVIPPQNQ